MYVCMRMYVCVCMCVCVCVHVCVCVCMHVYVCMYICDIFVLGMHVARRESQCMGTYNLVQQALGVRATAKNGKVPPLYRQTEGGCQLQLKDGYWEVGYPHQVR
jgi:hypothetical protein